MDSPVILPVSSPALTTALPGWTLPRGREPDEVGAAFAAGIALKSLDGLVRAVPMWAGCWRARQALKCAAVAIRLMGRDEDERALRDALLLTAAGDDPGPAGRVLLVFRMLAARKPGFSLKGVADLTGLLGFSPDDGLADVIDRADDVLQSGRAVPLAEADLVSAICRERPNAEPLAWALADRLIAAMVTWERPVPLLMAERYGPAFRTSGGRGRPAVGRRDRPQGGHASYRRAQGAHQGGRRCHSAGCSMTTPCRHRRPAATFPAGRRPGCSTG